jgi:hypothetical protein
MEKVTIRDELLALKDQSGMIVAEDAVEWARDNPQSDLHRSLQWNDQKAAQDWRVWQVRRLIAVHVLTPEGDRQVVSLSIDRTNGNGGGYREMDDVLARQDWRDVMLADALAELNRIEAKYKRLEALAQVWAAKAQVAQAVTTRRRRRSQPEADTVQLSA